MTFPAQDKTWQYGTSNATINIPITATGTALTTNRNLLLALKNALLAFGTLPWQVRGSCNGGGNVVTTNYIACIAQGAAGPATDLWTSNAALIWAAAGTAHSWIVLRQTGVSSFFEILISCEGVSGSGSALGVWASTVGFTGGTGIARPTATDETQVIAAGSSWGASSGDTTYRLHVEESTDGQCTRFQIYSVGVCVAFGFFDKPKNPVTGWTNPFLATWQGTQNGGIFGVYTTFFSAANVVGRGNANFAAYLTQECYNGGITISNGRQATNDLSGEWPAPAMGVYSLTASNSGRHGEMFDMRWAVSIHADGTTAPASGSISWEVVSDFWIPWTAGTAMLLS